MNLKVYSIYDNKVGQYAFPFIAHNNNAAMRMFTDHVNEPGSPPNRHPEDYILYYLADWDPETGHFEQALKPAPLLLASDTIRPTAPPAQLDVEDVIKRKRDALRKEER